MTICWPVMAPASGPSRNAVIAATSSGSMKRPIGGCRGGRRCAPDPAASASQSAAGATTFTVMPRGASSRAQDRAIATSAALVAAYWLRPAAPDAVRLPISTIRPPSGIRGTSASASREAASTWRRQSTLPASASSVPRDPARMRPAACTSAVGCRPSRAVGSLSRIEQIHSAMLKTRAELPGSVRLGRSPSSPRSTGAPRSQPRCRN